MTVKPKEKPSYDELLAFVEQMAAFTTPEQEYADSTELQEEYEDEDDYRSDLSDDRLCDEFSLFCDMIEAAQALVNK